MKTLFALSGNRCAMPSCDERLTDPAWEQVNAVIAHIRGLAHNSPRHVCTFDAVNRFENLLLLCPNHHRLVDCLVPGKYSTEDLLRIKQRSEERAPTSTTWATEADLGRYAKLILHTLVEDQDPSIRSLGPPSLTIVRQPDNKLAITNDGELPAFGFTLDPLNDALSDPRGVLLRGEEALDSHEGDMNLGPGEQLLIGRVTDEALLTERPEPIRIQWLDARGNRYHELVTIQ